MLKKKQAYKKRNKEYWNSLKIKGRKQRHNLTTKETKVTAFEIESEPPSFRSNPELESVLKRVEATVKLIKPGQAFIVPARSRHSIKKFIDQKWPELAF